MCWFRQKSFQNMPSQCSYFKRKHCENNSNSCKICQVSHTRKRLWLAYPVIIWKRSITRCLFWTGLSYIKHDTLAKRNPNHGSFTSKDAFNVSLCLLRYSIFLFLFHVFLNFEFWFSICSISFPLPYLFFNVFWSFPPFLVCLRYLLSILVFLVCYEHFLLIFFCLHL